MSMHGDVEDLFVPCRGGGMCLLIDGTCIYSIDTEILPVLTYACTALLQLDLLRS